MSRSSPEALAERVLNDVGICSPDDLSLLTEIAWQRGALVRDGSLSGAEARLVVVGQRAIITVSGALEPRRKRFGVAHELGHLELHYRRSPFALCLDADLDSWISRQQPDIEQEASQFAAALLLPERFFAPQCRVHDPSLEQIAGLADRFDVSLTATALRYTQFCDDSLAIVYSESGRIRWFRGSKDFQELGVFVDVGGVPHQGTYGDRYSGRATMLRTARRVPASGWFRPGPYQPRAKIVEQSWPMPSRNAVLTLLWVDEDIQDQVLWP